MKKIVSILLVLALFLPVYSLAQEEVSVYNWEDYICDDVLKMFEEETGIHVNYICFTMNEDMMVQVEADPSNFDVVFPSDYCIQRMTRKGLLDGCPSSERHSQAPSRPQPATRPRALWRTVRPKTLRKVYSRIYFEPSTP